MEINRIDYLEMQIYLFLVLMHKNYYLELDQKGICASAGSACSTGQTSPSHVLTAIGLTPELAAGTLRVTFGKDNSKEDVEYLVEALQEIISKIQKK